MQASHTRAAPAGTEIRLFLCGDVMTGRGIDQILPHPGDPTLHEPWVTNARDYVELAQRRHGPIRPPVAFDYIWGDALEVLQQFAPDARIVNLETSITASDAYWRGKGIHYRMQPQNTPCLKAAGIHCCALANNHVLDWGYNGLSDTLAHLGAAGIQTTGAGADLQQARRPAVIACNGGRRVLVYSLGTQGSGIPPAWAATPGRAGINLVAEQAPGWLAPFARRVAAHKRPGDIVVCSIHWGGNWGYTLPAYRRRLAQRLIDEAQVDIVHGHSSHHALGIEHYRGRPILYGCGDLINDYEGIPGQAQFRGDLALLYLLRFEGVQGRLLELQLVPLQLRRMRLQRARARDARWLRDTLDRESRPLGTSVELTGDNRLQLSAASG